MNTDDQKDIAPDASRPAESAGGVPDLDADALAAAAAAIARGERALKELPPDVMPNRVGAGGRRKREKILRTVLFINLILMGVMVALPDPETPEPRPDPGSVVTDPPEPPPGATNPLPEPPPDTARLPDDLWTRAYLFQSEGKYDEASDALLEYERINPGLKTGARMDLYTTLASFLFKAGRMEEAERYREKMRTLVSGGSLPEDLLRAAQAAWADGRFGEARRYYARFLLQRQQLTTVLRESVAEAYLRIGDSYRKAADK